MLLYLSQQRTERNLNKREAFTDGALNLCNFKYNDIYYMITPAPALNADKNSRAIVLNVALKTISLTDIIVFEVAQI